MKGENASEKWAELVNSHSTHGDENSTNTSDAAEAASESVRNGPRVWHWNFHAQTKDSAGDARGLMKVLCKEEEKQKNIPKCPEHQPDKGGIHSEADYADPVRTIMCCTRTGETAGPKHTLEAETSCLPSAQSSCLTLDPHGQPHLGYFLRKSPGKDRNGIHLFKDLAKV
ncbi:hypothetical protein WISP_16717 [Willisornis vidua]|uniref:Uncharacterized protein n=1 Tax=Willisornis vidua TaxID=1566151 RepID=A0ABQ9DQN9_9PASS|nr:hypothetical protein WISP_16717 [Willisornis vidua]